MFLRSHKRWKNGKPHRYFSIVENRRIAGRGTQGGHIAQRTVLYLGEINDSQQASWRKTLDVFDGTGERPKALALFPDDRPIPPDALNALQVKLSEMTPQGFPLAYEVMPGNTIDNTTLREFLRKIEDRYGKARRTWVMDRGIPCEATLAEMRQAGTDYLVGTPRSMLGPHAPGLTPRAVLEALGAIQMVDVQVPTTDGRCLTMPRHTQPEPEHLMILDKLGLSLPPQPPPRITAGQARQAEPAQAPPEM